MAGVISHKVNPIIVNICFDGFQQAFRGSYIAADRTDVGFNEVTTISTGTPVTGLSAARTTALTTANVATKIR